eukprot:SM000012S25441  [mRNA]  locus=s12:1108224:1112159:- [translate_table: standard]
MVVASPPAGDTEHGRADAAAPMGDAGAYAEAPSGPPLDGAAATIGTAAEEYHRGGFLEIARAFGVLGWTAFGGPAAHVGYFHKAFVVDRKWMSDQVFAELLALGYMLPGPSSSQFSFAVGITQLGPLGGLLSGALFQYPGLLLMAASGAAAALWLHDTPPWLSGTAAGMAAVAVALVAAAAVQLSRNICTDAVTLALCASTGVITIFYQQQWIFPALIFGGGLVTLVTRRTDSRAVARNQGQTIENLGVGIAAGCILLLAWLAVLVGSIALRAIVPYRQAPWAFYVTGSIIFGGGQVVLPLLESQVVQFETVCNSTTSTNSSLFSTLQDCQHIERNDTWVTEEQFLTGLAIAQSMPGPLFNFAAYLGYIIGGVRGVAICWLGLFAPGVLLLYAAMPFWGHLRTNSVYRKMLPGQNAAAVGLIWASLEQLGMKAYTISIIPAISVLLAIFGYFSTVYLKVPAPIVVIAGGAVGALSPMLASWLRAH